MAYATNTRGAARTDISSRLSGFFGSLASRADQYRVYRRTVNELSALSDRDLSDLGIHRLMINEIATEAAQRKA